MITACPAEMVGRSIATQGVYDLPVTEAIMRLADNGDTALDVGANIGYMSLVLAMSVTPSGHVLSFEPNPDVLPNLYRNVDGWRSLQIAPIEIKPIALSDRNGEAKLGMPADYGQNRGVATLEIEHGTVPVEICRLDSLEIAKVGFMKVDVEGHEASVFSGATKLLAAKLIRDIVFEEHQPFPAQSHKVLLDHGYQIFRLTRSTWRPLLLPAEAPSPQPFLPQNFLATTNPARAKERFREWGWNALSAGHHRQAQAAV